MNLIERARNIALRITAHRHRAEEIEQDEPAAAHDLRQAAHQAEQELVLLNRTLAVLRGVNRELAQSIQALGGVPTASPHITLALRHLEDAESRIHRETT